MGGQTDGNTSGGGGGKGQSQSGGGRSDAASGEGCVKLFKRAIDAFTGGFLRHAEDDADLGKRALLKKAHDDGIAVVTLESDDDFIEDRAQIRWVRLCTRRRIFEMHGVGRRFPMFAALLAANEIGRGELSADIKPA